MADIKLYGKIHNQDGNLLISPLEVAGVKDDGSIYEGAATKTNNIISYINSKTGTITTDVSGIKTDISGIKTDISGIKTNITTTKKEVKEYTDAQISTALSSVYKVKGTYLVSAIKNYAWKEGDVVDVIDSTGFMIDGKKYPPHTNIVFLQNVDSPKYDNATGFDKAVVDGLGGMIDASQIESNADKKYIKEIKYDSTVSPINLTIGGSKILGKLSYTIGNTTKSIDITAPISPIPKNTFEVGAYMNITQNANNFVFGIDYIGLQTAFNIINLNRSVENLETNKADVSTVTSLESRVSALESLLSLG